MLRYLVVDEFHSFDGAQGTDLACLIRRLRDRLQCPGDGFVCVGTSATLGGPESREAMLSYAGQIFASSFEPSALIEEERLSPEEFFAVHTAYGEEGLYALPLPGVDQELQLDPDQAPSAEAYLAVQAQLWLGDTLASPPEAKVEDEGWRLALGQRLGTLPAVHNLVRQQAAGTCSIEELLERFSRQLGLGDRFPVVIGCCCSTACLPYSPMPAAPQPSSMARTWWCPGSTCASSFGCGSSSAWWLLWKPSPSCAIPMTWPDRKPPSTYQWCIAATAAPPPGPPR